MAYCTLQDVKDILPNKVILGTNLQEKNVNMLESRAQYLIDTASTIIDSYLSGVYVIPLRKYKKPDFENGTFFTATYPDPIPLANARLAAAAIYDEIAMAGQTPNVSEWGKNQRALAFDDLTQVQSGTITLLGQLFNGKRFVRHELHDNPRVPRPNEFQVNKRAAGQ